MKNEICKGCGKLIDAVYLYCPWCGHSKVKKSDRTSANLRYLEFLRQQEENRRRQLKEMEGQLNDLEKELSVLVLSAEMHR